MEPNINALWDVLFRVESMLVMVSVWVTITVFQKLFPTVVRSPSYARVAPVLPLFVAEAYVFMPNMVPEGTSTGPRVLLGIVLGAASGHVVKFIFQSIYGHDRRITPPPGPTPPSGK